MSSDAESLEAKLCKLLKERNSQNLKEMVQQWKELFLQALIMADPSKEKGPVGSFEVAVDFINHIVAECPQMFVPGSSETSQQTPGLSQLAASKDSPEEEEAYKLLCWTMSYLMRLLCRHDCSKLWEKTLGAAPNILLMVQSKDVHVFHKLCGELVMALAELVAISDTFCVDQPLDHAPELKRFQVSTPPRPDANGESLVLPHWPIVLKDWESCEQLQVALTRILTEISLDLCLYGLAGLQLPTNGDPQVLWATLGFHLECGEVTLKTVSLDLCTKLLSYDGLPTPQPLAYFLDCLTALMDLLASGFNKEPGDYVKLETSSGDCLSTLIHIIKQPSCTDSRRSTIREAILDGIVSALCLHGTRRLRTSHLRNIFCDLLADLYLVLPGHKVKGQAMMERRKEVCRVLIQELGQSLDSQYAVKLLQVSIQLELPSKLPVPLTVEPEAESSGDEQPLKKKKLLAGSTNSDKSASADGSTRLSLLEKSAIFMSLVQKAESLIASLSGPPDNQGVVDTGQTMEGLRSVVEVLVQSVACSVAGNSAKTERPALTSTQLSQNSRSKSRSDSQGQGQVTTWSEPLSQRLCAMWKHQLMSCVNDATTAHNVVEAFGCIVKTAGALVFVQDVFKFSTEVLQTLVWILSLPWLPNDVSWLDLRPADSRDIATISSCLAEKIKAEDVATSVQILAQMPKEAAGKWRTHVLQMAATDTREVVRSSAIGSFPFLLYHSGPNANHLVRDVLHEALQDKCESVQIVLASTVGPLACVISRKAVLRRKPGCENLSFKSTRIQCSACDQLPGSSSKDRPKIVDPSMFLPFLEPLGKKKNVAVKKAFLENVERLFGHIGVKSNNSATGKMLSQCLKLMTDQDYEVRVLFSEKVQHLVKEGRVEESSKLVGEIKDAAKAARRASSNGQLSQTVMWTVGQLAQVAEGELLMVLIVILLDTISNPCCPLAAATSQQQLHAVAAQKKIGMRNLFMQFGKSLCKFLVDHMHDAQRRGGNWQPLDILQEVTRVFQFSDVKTFLRRTEHFLLPHLVKKATSGTSAIIKIIAQQLGDPNHKGPLARNIRHIFCDLVCQCNNAELVKALQYLQTESEWDLCALLRSGQNIDSELLLHLGSHYDQVLKGLKIWVDKIGTYKGTAEEITDEKMAELLQPKLLGVLVHFDNYLNNGIVPLEEKQKAYNSVISLMKLMGPKHITAVRVRIMTTLKLGEKFSEKGFLALRCRAWNCFVHSVELSALGPMLSQVVVNLLPLLENHPKQVAEILTYLIVDNRKTLEQHFHELYFLPDTAELADINAVLKNFVCHSSQSLQDLKKQIERLLKGVNHESQDVRQLAVTKLRHLLHSHQEDLHRLIQGSETADPVIGQMISAVNSKKLLVYAKLLLAGCRESDSSLRSLYGVCLGELGAIDPGRLDFMQNRPREILSSFQASVTEDNFAVNLINELAKAFLRATDNNTQDCVAYAIQELINIYGIKSEGDSEDAGKRLWRRFSEEVQEIMGPFILSRYIYKVQMNWSTLSKPIYRSKKGSTFESWVSTWTGYLGSKVEQEKAKKVFDCCCGIIKNDSQVALYLLPHAIVHVLLSCTERDQQELAAEVLAVLNHVREPETRHGSASDLRHLSAQTVFSLLDHLRKWTRHRIMLLTALAGARKPTTGSPTEPTYSEDSGYKQINGFLARIPQDTLAYASYNCNAYTRALMHYEHFIKSCKDNKPLEEHHDPLQKLYVEMDEPDGVAGMTAIKQSSPTLSEQIMAYESIGQLSDASACYDRAIQLDPTEILHRKGLLKCRLELGELTTAMDLANGMIAKRSKWHNQLNAFRVEAAWKLGQWDELQICLKSEEGTRGWHVGLGKLLLAVKHKAEEDFTSQLQIVRKNLMGPLSAASMEVGSYHRGYECILRLHMLNELEEGAKVLLNFPKSTSESDHQEMATEDSGRLAALMDQWETRSQFTQSSYRFLEPILNLRRILLTLAKQEKELDVDKEIGQCWLQAARVARECGLVQTAHSSLLSASAYNLPEFCLEKAKWLWDRGDFDKAQWCLEQAVEEHYQDRTVFKSSGTSVSKAERLACAKVLLLLGRYSEENASCESNSIMKQYKEVNRIHGEWEDGYFYIAKYYDKIMIKLVESDRPEKKGEFIFHVVQNHGQSLLYGSQYIYQSMPRMLSLWLDYGAELAAMEVDSKRNDTVLQGRRTVLTNLNKQMSQFCQRLPPYQFLTAFPQLISRICHAQPDVFQQLKELIAKLLVAFPQQAMWMLMAVSKSSYQMRVKRCQEIFSRAISMCDGMKKFLQDATKLTDRLLELCNKNVESGVGTLSISSHFKTLLRMISDRNFSAILIPLQDLMTPSLPSAGVLSPGSHDPFQSNKVFIKGIEDTVEVLPSLQRPKKITLRGSNGRLYIMLCKPKDDLRKDARLMEFNSIINKCLRKNPESRRRDLHIRTYTVTPLNEECGLLEWVSNTAGLRHILLKLYRERNIYTTGRELRSLQLPVHAPSEKKLDVYLNKLLPKHPAVFSEWFLRTFPDPTSWYNARLAYCRTTAVMSMVGYILGLGDRHGENILMDSTSGDCVHVDFNCLFNKGETFDYPETVPFRLTHNMVDAMGLMGHEGIFRRACEVTLRVMRDQTDPLMSVLKTFIYDPLVEWSKPASRGGKSETGEIKNEKAQTHVNNIEARLKGVLKNKTKPRGLPLSVEGHVNHLLNEATDKNNLSAMYIGWAAYM